MSKQSVSELLEQYQADHPEKMELLEALRGLVGVVYPEVEQRVMYGGIMFSLDAEDWGGLFASKKHLSFEFSLGANFEDPEGHLEGGGKLRRHLKLTSPDQIESKTVEFFVRQVR